MLPGIDLCTITSLSSMIMLLNSYPKNASFWSLLKQADYPYILSSLNKHILRPILLGYLISNKAI